MVKDVRFLCSFRLSLSRSVSWESSSPSADELCSELPSEPPPSCDRSPAGTHEAHGDQDTAKERLVQQTLTSLKNVQKGNVKKHPETDF